MPELEAAVIAANSTHDENAILVAEKALQTNRTLIFNNRLDAVVAGTFLFLVTAIALMSLREWILLLARRKAADLHETPPVWLPDYALAQTKPLNAVALLALAFALVKELSGEADLDRAREQACSCEVKSDAKIYTQVTEERFKGVRRCC
jgi:carbon starvation protein